MGRVKIADDLLGMWVNIFSSAPLSAIVPVLMILFGFGRTTPLPCSTGGGPFGEPTFNP